MNYWLFKTEPESYSLANLQGERRQTTFWNGVRNYQARNFLRDQVQVGDQVFFYHSNNRERAIVGLATVVRDGYPDHTAWEPGHHYYDPKSQPESPCWYMVDIQFTQEFSQPLPLEKLKQEPRLKGMELLKRGSMLSIQPVSAAHASVILTLAEQPAAEQSQPASPTLPVKKRSAKSAVKVAVKATAKKSSTRAARRPTKASQRRNSTF